jgi:hypothetical protein
MALMTDQRDVLTALLRTNFHAFAQRAFQWLNPGTKFMTNWHLLVMAHYLEEFAAGRIKRLIINLPPRGVNPCSPPSYSRFGSWYTTPRGGSSAQVTPPSSHLDSPGSRVS